MASITSADISSARANGTVSHMPDKRAPNITNAAIIAISDVTSPYSMK